MGENLIDLCRFMLHPVAPGKGAKLFADGRLRQEPGADRDPEVGVGGLDPGVRAGARLGRLAHLLQSHEVLDTDDPEGELRVTRVR